MKARIGALVLAACLMHACSDGSSDTTPDAAIVPDAGSGGDASVPDGAGDTGGGAGQGGSDAGQGGSGGGLPPSGLRIVGYLGYDLASGVALDQLTSGVWEVVQPTDPSDMTLVRVDGGDMGESAATLTACQAAGIPCMFSLYTPWDEPAFNEVFTTPALSQELIDNIVTLMDTWGFDGVDLDWESDVQSNLDVTAFSQFVAELRTALPAGKIIGTASAPNKVTFDPSAAQDFDYIGVMTYDVAPAATWYGTMDDVQSSMDLWADAGFPKDKLVLGISFAARYATGGGWFSYASVVDQYDPAPGDNAAGDLVFNGIDLVTEKAQWIEDNGFGGAFVYTVNLDKLNDPRSLLQHIYDTIGPQ